MKIVTVVGARPQFIKAAVLRHLFESSGIEEILVHTGQHYDHEMSSIFFSELEMRAPEYKLSLEMRTHGAMTGEILAKVEAVLFKEKPDLCLLYGDTNSTLAGALAASKLHIPVCHIEAGLRSFNKKMPEETNRILTDHLSDLLFCSTTQGVENLKNEGINDGVFHVGDIMQDAISMFIRKDENKLYDCHENPENKPLAILTIHRQENLDNEEIFTNIIQYCKSYSTDYCTLFPAHPRTLQRIQALELDLGNIQIINPLSYLKMQSILSRCELVMTDSGGLQKEAYFHRVRCITLREETEWIETIDAGWNRLWEVKNYERDPVEITEYGNGDAGKMIVKVLQSHLG